MPAFRWWEKDTQRAIVTNHVKDAAELERRVSNGRGLLYEDGASRANILSGDAPHSLLTMSTVLDRERTGRFGQDYYGYFARPYAALHTLFGIIAEIVARAPLRDPAGAPRRAAAHPPQLVLRARARVGDGDPARPAGRRRDLRPATPAGRSPTRRSSPTTRSRTTPASSARTRWRCCARSTGSSGGSRAPPPARRGPYQFVVLADHGQSQGATFLQRYDESLEQLVTRLCEPGSTLALTEAADTGADFLDAELTGLATRKGAAGRTVNALTRSRRDDDGEVALTEGRRDRGRARAARPRTSRRRSS